jgi:hypothetical protein
VLHKEKGKIDGKLNDKCWTYIVQHPGIDAATVETSRCASLRSIPLWGCLLSRPELPWPEGRALAEEGEGGVRGGREVNGKEGQTRLNSSS